MTALILTDPLERGLLHLAKAEGLIEPNDRFWSQQFAREAPMDEATRAHVFANVFLHPEIKVGARHELEIPMRTDLLQFDQSDSFSYDQQCDDMSLLIGYCMAVDPNLTIERIAEITRAYCTAREEVERLFGGMPGMDVNGQPILMKDLVQRATTKVEPRYSQRKLAAFKKYRRTSEAAETVSICIADIHHAWRLRTDGNPVAFHPRMARSYDDVLAQSPSTEDELTETDLFFLTVKSLRTLPVGRTLRETLELGATKEGIALRARVSELYGELQSGRTNLTKLIARIDSDAERYRSLTARLTSPHFLSTSIDMVLSGLGLIPVVGSYTSGLSLAKSGWAMKSTVQTRGELRQLAWATYQGRAL